MPIYSEDGQQYENEALYRLGEPTNESKDLSGNGKKEPLKVTITPHMQAGESEQGAPEGGLTEPKEVHIVRHGETQANDTNTVRGQDPIPLNENGRAEAEKAADELKSKGVDTIVASDLKRSRETAEIIGKKLGITPTYDRRLRTWDVGDHTGQPCETSNPILKEYAQNKQDEPVPGGESFNDFQNRSFAGIRDAVLNNKDKNLAIVTHNRVEATLKGWEKTGQDNPDIDYNEVVKEETEPGTVRTVQFKPDATILQPNMQVAENFSERFGRWGVINPGRYEVYSHPGMFERVPGPNREPFQNIPEEGKGTEPIIKKQINPSLKSMRQSLVDHIMGLGENAVASLHDILLHPENLIGPGNLGAMIPKAGSIEALRAAGKTVREIAKELGISSYKVRDILYGRKGDRVTPEPKGKPNLKGQMQNPSQQQQAGPRDQYPDVYKYMMEQFEKKSSEDFNTANRGATQLQRPANENVKDSDTIEHPLMNLFEHWVNLPKKSLGQEAYEKATTKQKKTAENTFKGADRNKYPNTYKIKDEDLLKNFDEVDDYLRSAKHGWDKGGYDPDLFKLEFAQKHAIKDELNERIKKLPQNKGTLDAFLNYLKDKLKDD